MALIFPKSTDKYVRLGALALVAAALGGVALAMYIGYPKVIMTGYQPQQPVPYSHKLHVGDLGMDCYYCHYTANKSGHAAVPATEVCMNCHARVKPQALAWRKCAIATPPVNLSSGCASTGCLTSFSSIIRRT